MHKTCAGCITHLDTEAPKAAPKTRAASSGNKSNRNYYVHANLSLQSSVQLPRGHCVFVLFFSDHWIYCRVFELFPSVFPFSYSLAELFYVHIFLFSQLIIHTLLKHQSNSFVSLMACHTSVTVTH